MFTGIVDSCAILRNIERRPGFARLTIETRFTDLEIGESVAVDGACLTVVADERGTFLCELSEETLRLTIAAGYRPSARLNVERALRVGDRLGGHYVTGHIDGTGRLIARTPIDACVRMEFAGVGAAHRPFLLPKGSVAVNGVSLTVNEVGETGFAVMVIPHTLERTNLGALEIGTTVNLEFDWMTKVILGDAGRVRGLLQEAGK